MLESLIVSTGHFRRNGEVLKDDALRVFYPAAYVKGLARESGRLGPHGHFVCHVKINHLASMRARAGRHPVDPASFLRTLADDGWRAIYLRREDRVRHALSNLVARAHGIYHTREKMESLSIRVERSDLERLIRTRSQNEETERVALHVSGIPVHEVVYELDLLAGERHQVTVDRIMDFLSLERRPVQTSMQKVNARPISETVENYDEFEEWVRELSPTTELS